MKKILTILLVMALMVPMATFASAAENTMTLKTTVPAATYTFSIPATLEIPFGAEEVDLPMPLVLDSSGFQGRDLCFYISDVVTIGNDDYRLPMRIMPNMYAANSPEIDLTSGERMYYIFDKDGVLESGYECYVLEDENSYMFDGMSILFEKEDWYKLSPGEHTGYIEFTSEVVPNVMGE